MSIVLCGFPLKYGFIIVQVLMDDDKKEDKKACYSLYLLHKRSMSEVMLRAQHS